MADFLDMLAKEALKTVDNGYYRVDSGRHPIKRMLSLRKSIANCEHAPIIAEIKPASPSSGMLKPIESFEDVAGAMERGGAVGISVLTEPKYFGGSLAALAAVKKYVNIPVLMKDIIVDPAQVEAADFFGADAVLLILSVFERNYARCPLGEMIELAHSRGLEVLLEAHDRGEFLRALGTDTDLVGVNNRDLRTLKVDLKTTQRILSRLDRCEKIVVSESGIQTPDDVRFLRNCGAHAFLVGSALMRAENLEKKVQELVLAI
jgi:indole-3-glycerol phosphate synthase